MSSPHALARATRADTGKAPEAQSSNSWRTTGTKTGSWSMLAVFPRTYPRGGFQHQRPASTAAFIPATVRPDRTSLSNCAKTDSMPSRALPLGSSLIGSVALRSTIPYPASRFRVCVW